MFPQYKNVDFTLYCIIECLIFFKYFTFKEIWRKIQYVYDQDENLRAYFKLVNLVVFLIFIAHLSALGFFGITKLEKNYYNATITWADIEDLQVDNAWWREYIYSFHWAISAMVTVVVYSPQTLAEVIFMCFIQFVTCGIFAYSINVLGSIMADISKIKKEMKSELLIVNRYMNKKQLSSNLRSRVSNYIQYLHSLYKERTSQEEEYVIEKLSLSLREEILKEVNGRIADQFSFLKAKFSQRVMQKIMYFIEEIHISQHDDIYQENELDDCALYFIEKGSVECYHESVRNSEEQVPVITDIVKEKQIFGLISFITGEKRENSTRSLEWGTLYKISRDNFIQILLNNNKQDYELFCYMRDEILYRQNLSIIKQKCQICQRNNHKCYKCPNAHFIANPIQIIRNYIADTIQQRAYIQRKKPFHTYNSINNNTLIQSQVEQFQQQSGICDLYGVDQNSDNSLNLDESIQQEESKIIWENAEEEHAKSISRHSSSQSSSEDDKNSSILTSVQNSINMGNISQLQNNQASKQLNLYENQNFSTLSHNILQNQSQDQQLSQNNGQFANLSNSPLKRNFQSPLLNCGDHQQNNQQQKKQKV